MHARAHSPDRDSASQPPSSTLISCLASSSTAPRTSLSMPLPAPSCRAQSAACHRPPLLLSSERGGRGEPGRVRTGAAILPRQICGEAGGCGAGAAPVLESFHDFLPESAQPLCDQLLSRPSPCMRLALAAPFGSPEPQPDPQPEPQPDPQPAPSSNN